MVLVGVLHSAGVIVRMFGARIRCIAVCTVGLLLLQVRLSWQGPSGAAAGSSCDSNSAVQWPALQGLVILGAPAANPASVTMQVRAASFQNLRVRVGLAKPASVTMQVRAALSGDPRVCIGLAILHPN